jgi:hypothetical protein
MADDGLSLRGWSKSRGDLRRSRKTPSITARELAGLRRVLLALDRRLRLDGLVFHSRSTKLPV